MISWLHDVFHPKLRRWLESTYDEDDRVAVTFMIAQDKNFKVKLAV